MESKRDTLANSMKHLLLIEYEEEIEFRKQQYQTFTSATLAKAGVIILKLKVYRIGNGPYGKVIITFKSFKKSTNTSQETDYWIPPSKISNGDIVGILCHDQTNEYNVLLVRNP